MPEETNNKKITIDKPEVAIYQMKMDALKVLADDTKDIFSELKGWEIEAVATAIIFAKNPCPNINAKLQALGIEPITLPLLDDYVVEFLCQRLKKDRKRVVEYLKALENLTPRVENRNQSETMSLGEKLVGGRRIV